MLSSSLRRAVALAALALLPGVATAQNLNGKLIKGTLTFSGFIDNDWDQGDAAVAIGGPSEFTYSDPFSSIEANWDASGFTIQQSLVSAATNSNGWVVTFTSVDPGLFASIEKKSDGFDPGLLASLVGNTITVSWAGGNLPRNYVARFNIVTATSVVPEPATYALLGTGLIGLSVIRRRRAA